MAFESGSSVWGEDSNVNNREKVNLLTVNWQLFQVDKLTAPTPAANLRCRVLPRVRPHTDLSRICNPIFGRFLAGGLTRGKTLQRRALSRIVADITPIYRGIHINIRNQKKGATTWRHSLLVSVEPFRYRSTGSRYCHTY